MHEGDKGQINPLDKGLESGMEGNIVQEYEMNIRHHIVALLVGLMELSTCLQKLNVKF